MKVTPYQGDRDFAEFLFSRNIPLSVWEIKAFVLGIVIGPEYVPPSWVLEELLLKDTEDEIGFENEADTAEFMNKFFSMWNHLAEYRQTKKKYALAPVPTPLKGTEYLSALDMRTIEISNFLGSFMETGSSEVAQENNDMQLAIENLENICEDHENLLHSVDPKKIRPVDEQKILSALKKSQKIWDDSFQSILEGLFT